MQRKALKQLNKVTQWTNEKVFSGERTHYSEEFAEFEDEIEPIRKGIERLHATSVPFYEQVSKVKPTADPYPPSGTGAKDKINVGEALGLVMIDYGNDAGGNYGDGLIKYGRARCKVASVTEDFGERLHDFTESTDAALAAVNEYKLFRKKMDSRRLTLDSALTRLKSAKKDNPALEQEVEIAQQRFEEAEDETKLRMLNIKHQEAEQFAALQDIIDAEFEYYTRCRDLLENLRDTFPSEHKPQSRPRAKSSVSSRSVGGRTPTRPAPHVMTDSDDDGPVTRPRSASRTSPTRNGTRNRSDSSAGRPRADSAVNRTRADSVTNRARSDSNASASKGKTRSIMGSIGKLGSSASKMAFGKKDGNVNLASDDEEPKPYDPPIVRPGIGNRARSHSVVSVVTGLAPSENETTPRRRALTSPSSPVGTFVKALYEFEGLESDELPLRRGQIIEVTKEVSADWLLGVCEGMSGIFPRAYTEEYIPTPHASAPLTARRLPPVMGRSTSRTETLTTDDETDNESNTGDADDDNTPIAAAAQPVPTSGNRSRAGSLRKPAPPPPPSRRTSSNNNIAALAKSPPFGRSRSSTVSRSTPLSTSEEERSTYNEPFKVKVTSPFDHSDDEFHQH